MLFVIWEFSSKVLAGVDCFDHAQNTVLNQHQTNLVYLHDVAGIRANEETNRNAKPGFGVNGILALVLLPIAADTQEEYPLKQRFWDFK